MITFKIQNNVLRKLSYLIVGDNKKNQKYEETNYNVTIWGHIFSLVTN